MGFDQYSFNFYLVICMGKHLRRKKWEIISIYWLYFTI